jgi:hypothetical protein
MGVHDWCADPVRGDHFEKVTGRLIDNAIHDAARTRTSMQQPSANAAGPGERQGCASRCRPLRVHA